MRSSEISVLYLPPIKERVASTGQWNSSIWNSSVSLDLVLSIVSKK